jgi:putative methyltransferase (TIGR04325 family)
MNLTGILFLGSARNKESMRVLDLGGGAGDNYFTHRRNLHQSIIHWQILDSDVLWTRFHNSKNLVVGEDRIFFSQILEKVDLLLIIGTIQYLTKKYLFEVCIETSPDHIVISRSPLTSSENDLEVDAIQSTYDNLDRKNESTVPITIYSVSLLIRDMGALGYFLVSKSESWPQIVATPKSSKLAFYQDLHFKPRHLLPVGIKPK